MEISVRKLFDRYERFFNQPLGGDVDREGVASGSTGGCFFNRIRKSSAFSVANQLLH
ncbi:hypothetical protein FHT77_001238 [Rhizobium sp. BK181]|uniref:hypothetical protein n=1 Tax=Rhizobium sp. BK181 TaxID=2587072 RepID=UPI0018045F63|nr:hypothetical protein [Rhizobium sp. BK181]MBB3315396.1 hypothetical protein [Rhizobium sp. BK181]